MSFASLLMNLQGCLRKMTLTTVLALIRLHRFSKLTESTSDMLVAPVISQSLTVLTSRLAHNAYPVMLADRYSFCLLFL